MNSGIEKLLNIVFRVDASYMIGSGHVMRCLALAQELVSYANICFITQLTKGNLVDYIIENGFSVDCFSNSAGYDLDVWDWKKDCAETRHILQKNGALIDWVIVDHYKIDNRWEKGILPYTKKMMVIDDLANRRHCCHLLLDQNFYHDMQYRYKHLIPNDCLKLFGPSFSLLRREFSENRPANLRKITRIHRILIFCGGSDHTGETIKILKGLELLNVPELNIDVIIGIKNRFRGEIEKFKTKLQNLSIHFNVKNMAKLMIEADLYIGSAGITTWERCCLGLASIVITTADNQKRAVKDLADQDILHYIGDYRTVTSIDIKETLECFINNPKLLEKFSINSFDMVDGLGAERCVKYIIDGSDDQ